MLKSVTRLVAATLFVAATILAMPKPAKATGYACWQLTWGCWYQGGQLIDRGSPAQCWDDPSQWHKEVQCWPFDAWYQWEWCETGDSCNIGGGDA